MYVVEFDIHGGLDVRVHQVVQQEDDKDTEDIIHTWHYIYI